MVHALSMPAPPGRVERTLIGHRLAIALSGEARRFWDSKGPQYPGSDGAHVDALRHAGVHVARDHPEQGPCQGGGLVGAGHPYTRDARWISAVVRPRSLRYLRKGCVRARARRAHVSMSMSTSLLSAHGARTPVSQPLQRRAAVSLPLQRSERAPPVTCRVLTRLLARLSITPRARSAEGEADSGDDA